MEDNDDVVMAALDHRRPGFGGLCGLWHRADRGCSCRGCGGVSSWLFLPWLRRRKLVAVLPWLRRRMCVGEGVGTCGWMPPRQLVAAVPRWSRSVVGEGLGEG